MDLSEAPANGHGVANGGGVNADHADDAAVSDADSDELELRLENARFEREVQVFLDSHQAEEDRPHRPKPRRGRPPQKGLFRSSRKEVEPRPDIKLRLTQVNGAFLRGDYAQAERMIHEIIRINAETYQAWTTLATILEDQGRHLDALTAKLYASFLRDKDDAAWVSCARLALELAGDDDGSPMLKTASMCFANAIKANSSNDEARTGRAEVNHRRGHLAKAVSQYGDILKRRPNDINTIRKLADVCSATQNPEHISKATAAYENYLSSLRHGNPAGQGVVLWADISIFVDLLICARDYESALFQLKSLARWRLSREEETFWDGWTTDDREWDRDDDRRVQVPAFEPTLYLPRQYGSGLPLELRAQLGLCRIRLGHTEEFEASPRERHLSWLDPTESATAAAVESFPGLARDIANALFEHGAFPRALDYFEMLRDSSCSHDPELLFNLGMCYVNSGDTGAAEDCFLLTIEVDENNIHARVELARIYEQAHEDEEALILVTEAIALQDMRGVPREGGVAALEAGLEPVEGERMPRTRPGRKPGTRVARRYRPKRLVGADQRKLEERERADELSRRYKDVRHLKRLIQAGDRTLVSDWMAAARDLVDDFRSFRRFYTWDKYVKYLGAANDMVFNAPYQVQPGTSELHQFAERLSRNVIPGQVDESRPPNDDGYRGIPFGEWLELFLDYAICLAMGGNGEEAYSVCEAARDSIVFTNSKDYMFLIHVAWAACAIYMADDEVCVAMGRFFLKVNQLDSDAYRMFAALCRFCQSPASWYNSGPVQKFILRQIRVIDATQIRATMPDTDIIAPPDFSTANGEIRNLDVCLLMLYGHVLFTSTSYTFALNYFLRARALAPRNPMVNLSVGLGYVHHGLKRQADNRQYLIMQGMAAIFEYADIRAMSASDAVRREVSFTVARVFHMLGLHHLAHSRYLEALDGLSASSSSPGCSDIRVGAAFNEYILLSVSQDPETIEEVLSRYLYL
ncbi:hypothetical protein F5X68DRAFT_162044 [Plectosphaerella plurivora]|uniref:Uncharacterized protein n=1 Tax=Plectosphaerella plurivora TaxID=936078 RepID=A0A9P9A4U6_9PEZI|nr:hypothetical protein F5X68DRAFT_162044 [Plectosphaerella plurivora]